MKVSIIIPFHKGLSFLEDCLQSLVEQRFEDMEIILVCDRVEEEVKTFLASYKAMQIKMLELESNSGVAAARNYGLSEAEGEYIYFLDSDDYLGATTLELLVKTAKDSHCDLAYGKTISTWFTRSMYLQNNNDSEEEDKEEDNNFSESAELNMENGEEAVSSSLVREAQLFNGKSEEKETFGKDKSDNEQEKIRAAYFNLITDREGVRNISVLNILIRRSVITKNQIRFNENIKYLSDYPFLLQVLDKTQSFEYEPQAVYMKRNHNDAANMPLSQRNNSKSFREYVDTYHYAIGLLDKDSELRTRLDRKMIHYCITFFAPKLIETQKVEDRAKKFEELHQIVHNMNQTLMDSQKGYNRRILRAFYQGDIDRARKTVKSHLKWVKFKKITKNKTAFSKFLYLHFFLKRPMKNNWVFCESFFGKNYSDSPKYIYEYISKNYPRQFKFIWVIDKKDTGIPYKHTKVKHFSFRYFYYLARSKYYVFNGRQPEWVRKKKGNVFLQTWHGTPLKRLVFDLDNINSTRQKYKDQTFSQSRAWDYLIAANQYSSDIFRRCFKYQKVMLETGYPRNDILHDKSRDQIALGIRKKLGIPEHKKVILYAPTWRDDVYYTKGRYKFELKLDLQLLKEKLGKEYVILIRTHYFIAESIDKMCYTDFTYNLSNYDDISELYLISSILITDYSSVFFDYANLKRPMLFFTYDLDKYRDILRGFYIDIEEELPGPLLFTTEEIVAAVNNIDGLQQDYQQKYNAFYEKYCSWEDGNASGRVAEEVFGLKGR